MIAQVESALAEPKMVLNPEYQVDTDPNELINGYLDCSLSPEQNAMLNGWIKLSPENAKQFASATLLHNRLHVHYQSLSATLNQLDNIRIASVPHRQTSRRWIIGASVLCLLLVVFWLRMAPSPDMAAVAAAEFHELVIQCRKPGDRTYRVTFVKEASRPEQAGENRSKAIDGPANEAQLYVRNGRQFVYSWRSGENRESLIGSNGRRSWSIRNGDQIEENDDPMHFTGLPEGKFLTPILTFFDGQEKMLVADYFLEIKHPSEMTNVFRAVKKLDTIQGPRQIEITSNAGRVSEMKIWPDSPDNWKSNYTLIQLANQETLAQDWFMPSFHVHKGKLPEVTGDAD